MSFVISGNFFCRFKIGDNIIYNLEVLKALYEYDCGYSNKSVLLIKPKVIIIVAIIEAILYDFHLRIKINVYEGMQGLPDKVISYIRGKQIDEFEKYIQSSKKHNLLQTPDKGFYDTLDDLRKVRNRVHIQNTLNYKPENEKGLFNVTLLTSAEKCLEKIVKVISKDHARPTEELREYVEDLHFPWKEHFSKI